MPKDTARDVARYILRYAAERRIAVTNLKLQKLLQFSQGWYLAVVGQPLFDEPLQAWPLGGAVYDVWQCYKGFGKFPIVGVPPSVELSADCTVLDATLAEYAPIDQWMLVKMSHGPAWTKARGSLPAEARSTNQIQLEWLREEFESMAAERAAIERNPEEDPHGDAPAQYSPDRPVQAGDELRINADGQIFSWVVTQAQIDHIGDMMAAAKVGGGAQRRFSAEAIEERALARSGGRA